MAVVLAHVGLAAPVFGDLAVEAFFVLSGFYMALVLDVRYTNKWTFWANRALRIFPGYLLIAGLSALWLWRKYPQHFDGLGWFDAATNVLIIGQDVSTLNGARMLLPQGWTLALEMYFYALAPWIVRQKTGALAAAMVLALVGRVYFDTNRLFPFELAFFLGGILLYRAKIIMPTNRDKLLADLSYPVYINHIFIARMIHDEPFLVVVTSIAMGLAMVFFIERPLEMIRVKVRSPIDDTGDAEVIRRHTANSCEANTVKGGG